MGSPSGRCARTNLFAIQGKGDDFYRGKRAAAGFFFRWELPKLIAQFDLLSSIDSTTLDMDEAWF